MAGRASAFVALGLPPGADAAAIEQAYKRLIKQHHPDREGGDSSRAARSTGPTASFAAEERRAIRSSSTATTVRAGGRVWPVAALVAGAALGGMVFAMGPSVPRAGFWAAEAKLPAHHAGARAAPDPIAADLHDDAIDEAVRDAMRLYRHGDEAALAAASRQCQRPLPRRSWHPDAGPLRGLRRCRRGLRRTAIRCGTQGLSLRLR